MDLDAYSAAHRAEWDRLAVLAGKRRLDGAESDELIDLYQSGAAHLAEIKSTVGETVQGDHISLALAKARVRFTGTPTNPLRQLTIFFALQLPAAMYRIRWTSLIIAALTAGIAVVYGVWFTNTPGLLASLGSEDARRQYAEEDFVNYYSESSTAGFFGQVWTNNARLTALVVIFGITGLFPAYMLFNNAQGLGVDAAVMNEFGRLDTFFLYIAPHGQLELYSIFVAGAAGFLIFWSWVSPGARTRRQALAEDGRAFFTIAIGLTITLLMSGIIEGFVTRQEWMPWPIKIGIGTFALLIVLVYQWVVGRRAYRLGERGDVLDVDAGAKEIVVG
ncbi:MAG: stage II sporulation protein M [Pseudolysinimonas sp.]|uniref:stage II sporulation protein M n=1 Tax=Pseudolysinimonas sp. TaxID=2680009 RepID=UPI003263736C